jgi:serine phosphatase RsbU (regulator of sigma subunit)
MKINIILLIFIFSISAKAVNIEDLYNKIDSLYKTNQTECLIYAKKLEEISKNNKNDTALAYSYNIQAQIYFHNKKYNSSISYFNKELTLLDQNKNENIFAEVYYNIASAFLKINKLQKSKKYFNESLKISKKIKSEILIYSNYEALYTLSKKLGDYKTALEMYKLMQKIDEKEYNQSIGLFQKKYFEQKQISCKQREKLNSINENLGNKETELNYSSDKLNSYEKKLTKLEEDSIERQLTINSLNLKSRISDIDMKKKQEELKNQRRYTITFISAFFIILALSLFMYKLFLSKKKMNKNLITQSDKITKQNFQINNSIKYARKIQKAVLSSNDLLKDVFADNFILFKPRDIVSGDFYWFHKINDVFWGAIVDCTGHGVPGAFMSIIGNNLLNKIIQENEVIQPSKLLYRLDTELKSILNQKQNKDGDISEDGMDISVFKIDLKEKLLSLSLANHNAFLIQNNKISTIEGDIYSIGDSLSDTFDISFTDFEFKCDNNSKLYMFSDGFQDQFGGENDKKYTQKKLKEKIFEIHDEKFSKQKEILKFELKNWKQEKNQIDDVILVGIKF